MESKANILLVEDDKNLGFVIKDNLEVNGYKITHFENGKDGLKGFRAQKFDLCILDVMLPEMDGFTMAENIRAENKQVPILFLTAKSMKEDKIEGFKVGGDDYITKPFSIEELILRIQVFLKRTKSATVDLNFDNGKFKLGKYNFDHQNLKLICSNQEKTLTQKEADILKLFCSRKDTVLKREEILLNVWGDDDYFIGRSLDVFISKLRKYLAEDPSVQIINYHGVGFKLEAK